MKVLAETFEEAGRRVWLYRTEGLAPARAEVALALEALPGEANAPFEPLRFLEQSMTYALESAPLEPGRIDALEPALLGFRGTGMIRPLRPRFGGRAARSHRLDVLLLTRDEVSVAREQGLARVLAALGDHASPPVAVRGRASAVKPGDVRASALAGGVTRIPGAFALLEESGLTLVVLEDARERLASLLAHAPPAAPLLLATEAHPAGECWLRAGERRGPRASAAFVAFVPERMQDALEVVEDGVVLALTGATWSKVRAALVAGDDLEVALGAAQTLALDWRDAYDDLVGLERAAAEIRIAAMRVLARDDEVAERIGHDALHAFAQETLGAARRSLGAAPEVAHGLTLQATLRAPRGCQWVVTRQRGVRSESLAPLLSALDALPKPSSTGTVVFELTLEVVGGGA